MVNIKVFEEILVGWTNLALKHNVIIEEHAKKRISICVDCPLFNKNKTCKICGCYMPAKARSPKSHCPKKLW
jgi:hypothetical protein